jgi:hypothetical protein
MNIGWPESCMCWMSPGSAGAIVIWPPLGALNVLRKKLSPPRTELQTSEEAALRLCLDLDRGRHADHRAGLGLDGLTRIERHDAEGVGRRVLDL